MLIPREIIDEILYRTDIEQVIGSYVNLKKSGSRALGLCPFHSEKTPSFHVNTTDRYFHCFGCGAGGDVITFIMRVENLDYVSAIEFLADRAGIEIPTENNYGAEKNAVSRKRVLDMNLEAARFFRSKLFDPKTGGEALEYLCGKRGLSPAVIKHFGIGYSPNDFQALTDHMRRAGFTSEELKVGFLSNISQKTGKPFDYFRNRIIFPIIDTRGEVVAFGGRVMDDSQPKYLNTSDTPAFKKSKNLFALNFAKNHCAEELILCEGYMDVISLHENGFENAVATLGTAITSEHARIMSKYTKKVIIAYDGDSAGQNAADKAMRLLGEVGLDVRVLQLSGAKDPDEFIKKFGRDRFRSILSESKTGFEYKMNTIISKYNLSNAEDVIKVSGELCKYIASRSSGVEREIYISMVADKLGLSKDSLSNDVARFRNILKREIREKQGQQVRMSAMNIGDRVNPDSAKHIKAAATEEIILGMLLIYPEYRKAVASGKVGLCAEDFLTEFGRKCFSAIMELEQSDGGFLFSLLAERFSLDEMSRITLMEQKRKEVVRNDLEVFQSSIETLKKEREEASESDWLEGLRRQQLSARDRRKKQ